MRIEGNFSQTAHRRCCASTSVFRQHRSNTPLPEKRLEGLDFFFCERFFSKFRVTHSPRRFPLGNMAKGRQGGDHEGETWQRPSGPIPPGFNLDTRFHCDVEVSVHLSSLTMSFFSRKRGEGRAGRRPHDRRKRRLAVPRWMRLFRFGKRNGSRTCLVGTFGRAGTNLGRDRSRRESNGSSLFQAFLRGRVVRASG